MEAEVQGYLTEFGIVRGQIRDAIKELNDEGANWHPLSDGTNSVFAVLSHIISVDNFWVRQVIGGETVHRGDREADFRASGSLAELVARWEKAWTEIEPALAKLTRPQLLEERSLPFRPERRPVTVQWVILHLISHYANHLGHIQLTRQLWDHQHK
jgi:uncharacterized damage-inducible protein DinB